MSFTFDTSGGSSSGSSSSNSSQQAQGSSNPTNTNTAHPITGAKDALSSAVTIGGGEDFNTPTQGSKTVEISNFSNYKESFYTPIFHLCDSNWRLLIFPEGNNSPGNISIFLDYYDIGVNPLFEKDANLTLTLINQGDSKKNVKKTSQHKFSFKGVNWGFVSFLSLQTLLKTENGFLIQDKLKIKVEIQSHSGTIDKSDPKNAKPYGKFSYSLTNFSHHFENFYSPTYYVCGSNWRIYIFPNGYSSPNYFSVYLDLLDVKFKPLMSKHLFFAIEIVNQKYPEKNLKKWVDHQYDDKNMNFGFPKFVLLSTLLNSDLGYIVDDTIIINIEFTVMSSNCDEPSPNFEIDSNLNNPDCGKFTFPSKKNPNIDLLFSPTFNIAGSNWQLVSYPLENLTDYFSIYLDLVDIKTKPLLRKHISFAIEIVNQVNPSKSFKKYISNIYSYNSFSWLFQKFMKVSTLNDPKYGFIKNDTIIINVELIIISSDFLKPLPFDHTNTNLVDSPIKKSQQLLLLEHLKQEMLLSSANTTNQPTVNNTESRIATNYNINNNNNNNNTANTTNTTTTTTNNFVNQCYPSVSHPSPSNSIALPYNFIDECSHSKNRLKEESGSFCFDIHNFSTLDKSFYSPVFALNRTKWRFYIFPKGNSVQNFFSLYLDYVDPKTKPKIRQYICFILEVVNKKNPSKSEKKYSFHTFCYSSVNWGFKKFISLETIKDMATGFMEDDTVTVKVTIYFLSQSILDTKHLLGYSNERSKHLKLHMNKEDDVLTPETIAKQKTEEEAYYYHTIKLTMDSDFEKTNCFDLIDFSNHQPIKIRKTSTLLELKLQIQMIYGISFERQRIWFWDHNPNQKPSKVARCPVILDDEDIFNQYISHFSGLEMRFHLEVSSAPQPNDKNLFFDPIQADYCLIFFKYYDSCKQKIEFIASKVSYTVIPLSAFIPFLNQKIGNTVDSPLLLYGEFSMNLLYQLDPNRTLKSYGVNHGDIIYCQKIQPLREKAQLPFVSDYFNFVYNKVIITFQILNYKNINNDAPFSFKLEILKGMTFVEIVKRVAEVVQTFPQNINLYSVSQTPPTNNALISPEVSKVLSNLSLIYLIIISSSTQPTPNPTNYHQHLFIF
ncbi:hypothetical protein DFA_01656 [Cavenderia fasciculata]|uniref:MATH domain-containing protein n=1 Tax=Cavenderia fasciculata TaxID=261658 RepID=F4PU02_CACFS|nr:uncharacterized protein DFA_01656 [Cavenderia fasciculata]EGG21770.1 hypothetical protein DFA_01656 [Cavenderia fasciculata]|eukprot:XP_004359620.1 hypothetical protein DFA_01656 [Cavenderia fasciculata]